MKFLLVMLLFLASFTHSAEIYVHYDAEWGNFISLRGDSESLNWEKGQQAIWLTGNIWKWETPANENNFSFKPLINDKTWAIGKNYFVENGDSVIHIYPFFHAREGTLEIIPNFTSKILKNERALRVYLPPSYHENKDKHYPVLYMHDGQNLFEAETAFGGVEWQVDETANKMVVTGEIKETIIVGMDNTGAHRIREYTPSKDENYGGGDGEQYLTFIATEVIPFINQKYRTLKGRENTSLMGSSLGGLISFYAGWQHETIFGSVGCVSSSFWWDNEFMIKKVLDHSAPKSTKIYIDCGGVKDGSEQTNKMHNILLNMGYKEEQNLYYWFAPDGKHSESSWAKRLHIPFQFLLGK